MRRDERDDCVLGRRPVGASRGWRQSSQTAAANDDGSRKFFFSFSFVQLGSHGPYIIIYVVVVVVAAAAATKAYRQ